MPLVGIYIPRDRDQMGRTGHGHGAVVVLRSPVRPVTRRFSQYTWLIDTLHFGLTTRTR